MIVFFTFQLWNFPNYIFCSFSGVILDSSGEDDEESDKENASSGKKDVNKQQLFNIKLEKENRIIHSVPKEEIK